MKSIASCFAGFLKEIASNEELALVFLGELWPEIVGVELARQTRPARLQGKKLVLEASSEMWERELEPLNHLLKNAVNDYWGIPLVKKIEFRGKEVIID